MSPTRKIIQVSDIHFGGENVEAVQAALERFHAEKPDLLIAAGDLTRDGAVDEFDAAKAWMDQTPEPRLIAPGNHDAPYMGPLEIVERLILVQSVETARCLEEKVLRAPIDADVGAILGWAAKSGPDMCTEPRLSGLRLQTLAVIAGKG